MSHGETGTECACRRTPDPGPDAETLWAYVFRETEGERPDLIPILQRAQTVFGYLSHDTIRRIGRRLRMSTSEVYGVATFYAQFRFQPPARHRLQVCLGTACHVRGGVQLLETLERQLDIGAGETTDDGEFQLDRVACLGCCALAPVSTLDGKIYGDMNVLKLQKLLDGCRDA